MNRLRNWLLRLLLGAKEKEIATLIENTITTKLLSTQARGFSIEQLATVIQANANLDDDTKLRVIGALKSESKPEIYK